MHAFEGGVIMCGESGAADLEVAEVDRLSQNADSVWEFYVLQELWSCDASLLEGDLQPFGGGNLDGCCCAERRL